MCLCMREREFERETDRDSDSDRQRHLLSKVLKLTYNNNRPEQNFNNLFLILTLNRKFNQYRLRMRSCIFEEELCRNGVYGERCSFHVTCIYL